MSDIVQPVQTALEALRAGRPVVVADDRNREDEGDLIIAADRITTETMGFVVRHSAGVICVPMSTQRAHRLQLPPMTAVNQDSKNTAYTVSCDAAHGVGTGISAADRAHTARTLAADRSTATDLTRPGHMFPLTAMPGGVLTREGHTEAAVDLCRLAGTSDVGVIAELVHDDGSMMRGKHLTAFAARHHLPMLTVAQLRSHIITRTTVATPLDESPAVALPLDQGVFTATAIRVDRHEHLLLTSSGTRGEVVAGQPPIVRIQSECLTGDVFGSHRCDCGPQLAAALQRVAAEGGAVLYLHGHEGRGIGLVDKLRAYALQEEGFDTVEANQQLGLPTENRDYATAAAILHRHGFGRIRLLTNNPHKHRALTSLGIQITQVAPLEITPVPENTCYLRTKRDRMHHRLHLDH